MRLTPKRKNAMQWAGVEAPGRTNAAARRPRTSGRAWHDATLSDGHDGRREGPRSGSGVAPRPRRRPHKERLSRDAAA